MADLVALKKRRATIKGSVTKLLNYVKVINRQTPAEDIKVRLTNIERLRDEFCKVEDLIVTLDNKEEMDSEFEDNYYKIVAGLNKALRASYEPTTSSNDTVLDTSASGNHTEVKLPKISIPTFTGDYTEWQSFYDLFCSTIHDSPRLTPSQKLQYLKGALSGEAAGLLKHFSITDANYIEALKKLRERYDRKKHTIYMFIKKFMNQPSVTSSSSINVRRLLDTSDEIIRGLKALGETAESRDHWLIYILTSKLDEETNGLWAQSSANTKLPTLQQFFEFLGKRIDALESVRSLNRRVPPSPQQSPTQNIKIHTTITSEPCPLCTDTYHKLYECDKLKNMSVEQRKTLLKTQNRCFNCLNNNHNVFNCKSKFRCRTCGRKHHTLIHEIQPDSSNSSSQAAQVENEDKNTTNYSAQSGTSILPTALVNVDDGFQNKQECRVLLDSGSQRSFITESCVQRLRLKRDNAKITVTGIGGCKTGYTKGSVSLNITPRGRDKPVIQIDALILPKLTAKQPQSRQVVNINHFQQFELADPFFYKSADVDILIGTDRFFELLTEGKMITDNHLTLQNTVLGWIVAGVLPDNQVVQSFTISTTCNDDNLDDLLRRFWELENINTTTKHSEEEIFCERHFQETNKIDNSGRFVVRLPFKILPDTLGDTLDIAIQRMRSMEKKFVKNSTFAARYKEFMAEYLSLGHMKPISKDEQTFKGYYLPHHGVTKESSETTKLRVVFDGSAKSTSGHSLNKCLAVGPTVQSSLFEIISRFREFKVVFTSDVEKMFRQIRVADEDCKYQRIIWRDSPKEPFQHFELQTVTYGTASATFLATRALNKAAENHKEEYPKAANYITRNIYVDDLMAGADTIQEARDIKHQITFILSKSGFTLRKWLSNHQDVLSQTDHIVNDVPNLEIEESQSVKVLGLYWNPRKDKFQFRVQLYDQLIMTKRAILSEASRIFDPLGWIAPITVSFKIFLQTLWAKNLGWDDQLPEDILTKWLAIRSSLPNVEQIEIPRYINTTTTTKLELHGFSDASKDAYAAVVYSRVTNAMGETTIKLLSAKTRVSPIKQISIPRLELCAAVLVKKLLFIMKGALTNQVTAMYAWTDSTIVLDWLSAQPKKWNVFVGNRTSEILNDMNRSQWRHVSSQHNPADCASRGKSPEELAEFQLWWKGPSWLVDAKDWPEDNTNRKSTLEEERTCSLPIDIPNDTLLDHLTQKFSSFHKLVRVLAYVLKFIDVKLKRHSPESGQFLHASELQKAERIIFKHIQQQEFHDDIQHLKQKKQLSPTSRLKYLQPYLDEVELLRVAGRLGRADIKFNMRHPIILSAKNPIIHALVKEHHVRHLHAGATLMMATLRSKYWIISCRTLIRKVIHQCIRCVKYNAKELNQVMGDLPNARVELVRPFLKVGVDYAGPFSTYIIRRRGQKVYKSYVCLFICMATKAVHIELVSELTTDAFIGALRRFIARRGVCIEINCDNGSNFIGAANQLIELNKFLNMNANTISNFLLTDRISFKFIPPSSPHFGGLWEAAIKSTKFHLKRVTDGHILTMEEMTTLLAEIEAILNSRPICILSSDELDYITPGHFLIGRPTTQLPSKDIRDIKMSKLNRWQLIQQMNQHFWQRWHQEYLTNLQNRNKWYNQQKNVIIGDIVTIKDNNLPVSKWLLGRIIELHPGPDNNVRVVTLKTKNGLLKRPIHKLCLLPIN